MTLEGSPVRRFIGLIYDKDCTGCKTTLGICTGHILLFERNYKSCATEYGRRRFAKIEKSNDRW